MNEKNITAEDTARACHEANRLVQRLLGGEVVSPSWDDAPEDQRVSSVAGVETAWAGATSEELHDAWADGKRADGWVYGAVKDTEAKTHPCLVAYAALDEGQRLKDDVFNAVAKAGKLGRS